MTRRIPRLIVLALAAGCGSGHTVVPAAPEPAAAPAEPTAVVPPAPAIAPDPQVTPAPAESVAPGYAPYGGQTLQIRRIGQWSSSGLTAPVREIIKDDSAYARLWASLGAGQRPTVDFSRDVVIAVAAGQRMTGGHSIAVERVTRTGDGLAVEVVETVPGPGCITTQALTQPVDVVVVAGADARTWSFSDQTRAQGCQ
jgi:PrcB C-terminal